MQAEETRAENNVMQRVISGGEGDLLSEVCNEFDIIIAVGYRRVQQYDKDIQGNITQTACSFSLHLVRIMLLSNAFAQAACCQQNCSRL